MKRVSAFMFQTKIHGRSEWLAELGSRSRVLDGIQTQGGKRAKERKPRRRGNLENPKVCWE